MTRFNALLLTVLTGFSGLVYEVAWQKYVATLLGSHAEATAAVLAIFLGARKSGGSFDPYQKSNSICFGGFLLGC